MIVTLFVCSSMCC